MHIILTLVLFIVSAFWLGRLDHVSSQLALFSIMALCSILILFSIRHIRRKARLGKIRSVGDIFRICIQIIFLLIIVLWLPIQAANIFDIELGGSYLAQLEQSMTDTRITRVIVPFYSFFLILANEFFDC